MNSLRTAIVCASLLLASTSVSGGERVPEVEIKQHTFERESGDSTEYEIGTLFVPENRNDPASRTIGVGFARFPATKPTTAPPIFQLPGGPGSSLVEGLKKATKKRREQQFASLDRLREFADVVYVDQRGYSEHGDVLMATFKPPSRQPDQPFTDSDEAKAFQAFARKTVAKYADGNIDLRGYTVKECAHDVADLSKALGYDKITLQGTSFGSQWSFAVMRLHPQLVARALLSGIEPLNSGYDMPSYVFAAMQRMWRSVDADPRFKPYLPEGGVAEAARIVIERLEREPIKFEVPNGDSGEPEVVAVFGPDDFPWHDPTQIIELYHGKTQRWRWMAVGGLFARQRQIRLIGPLIDSSLGTTPERRHRLWHDPATRYLGRANFQRYLTTADIWPSPDVGDDFRTPIRCEIPVVFAQGDWDIQTPLENTFEIAPYFVNSRVIIAHRGGHGVFRPIEREHPKVWAELVDFLQTGDLNDIPPRVTVRPWRGFAPPKFPPPE